ncbi:MAG: homoserine O-succinyltransferase [Bacillota bacterium]
MPIVIPKGIPACTVLQNENVFVMRAVRAYAQDIRPIEICILNLMPTKVETETQLMRLLGNSPLQIKATLLATESYQSKNTSKKHLDQFYTSFSEIKASKKNFDGMIITGAPVETMNFEDVEYWGELQDIMKYAKKHVTSTMYICWGSQAGLYFHHGIEKKMLDKKLSGVYRHEKTTVYEPLLKGVDEIFNIPHSRYTGVDEEAVYASCNLEVIARSPESGIGIVKSIDNKSFFMSGHMEYDKETLKNEYIRDLTKGVDTAPPANYFLDDDMNIIMNWSATANLIMSNWLNYYVYQVTPYELDEIDDM